MIDMELYQLRFFLEVARTGKMTIASNTLNVTQPALSIAIRKLEDELGIPLFIRNGRSLSLSREGSRLLPFVEDIILREKEIRRLSSSMAEADNTLYVRVRDAMPLVIELVSKFHDSYPSVRVRLMTTIEGNDIEPDVIIDSSFRISSEPDAVHLLTEQLRLAVPRITYPVIDVPVPFDFINENQILGMSEQYALAENVSYYSQLCSAGIRPSIICTNISVLRNLLTNGTGLSIVPSRSWLFQNIPSLSLVRFEGDEWTVHVAAKRTRFRRNSSLVDLFIDCLVDGFASMK